MRIPIRILVADDHPIVRDGLEAVLGTQSDFRVVGTAANGIEAVERAAALQPDVLLLDLEMPEMDGVEALRRLIEKSPATRAIVFTAFETDERIWDAVRAGAQGYLLKGAAREDLFHAIRVVHTGGSLLQPVIASKLLTRVRGESTPTTLEPLTPRELEVLRLLAQGLQNKEIAVRLSITQRTVKFHVSAIMSKLGAGNRTEAVTRAALHGLVKL